MFLTVSHRDDEEADEALHRGRVVAGFEPLTEALKGRAQLKVAQRSLRVGAQVGGDAAALGAGVAAEVVDAA